MSTNCTTPSCREPVFLICERCQSAYCQNHSANHDRILDSQLNDLIRELNSVAKQPILTDPNRLLNDLRKQLDKWRSDSHNQIEILYNQKLNEFNRHVVEKFNLTNKSFQQIKLKFQELSVRQTKEHEDIDQINQAKDLIDKTIREISKKAASISLPPISFSTNTATPSIVDNVNQSEEYILNITSDEQTIYCSSQSGIAFAASNRNILVNEYRSLLLIGGTLNKTNKIPWTTGQVYDICWSASINKYVVVTDKKMVYTVDDESSLFHLIKPIPQEKWWSCTSSEKSLYLSTYGNDPNIVQFDLSSSSFLIIKRWKSPDTCQLNETLSDMVYHKDSLALTIVDSTNTTARLELRSATSLTLRWKFPLKLRGITYQPTIHCCALRFSEWLISIEDSTELIHIDDDGELKAMYSYREPVRNILVFNSDILAVRAIDKIIFHRI